MAGKISRHPIDGKGGTKTCQWAFYIRTAKGMFDEKTAHLPDLTFDRIDSCMNTSEVQLSDRPKEARMSVLVTMRVKVHGA